MSKRGRHSNSLLALAKSRSRPWSRERRAAHSELKKKFFRTEKGKRVARKHGRLLKGRMQTLEHRRKNSRGVKRAIAEGRLSLKENARKGWARKDSGLYSVARRRKLSEAVKLAWEKRGSKLRIASSSDSKRVKASISGRRAWRRQETRKRHLRATYRLWKDPRYCKKVISGWRKRPNSLEVRMMILLTLLGYDFEFQRPLCGFIVDFLIPKENVVVECDGRYWHSRPGVPARDRRKNRILGRAGYKVIRWRS